VYSCSSCCSCWATCVSCAAARAGLLELPAAPADDCEADEPPPAQQQHIQNKQAHKQTLSFNKRIHSLSTLWLVEDACANKWHSQRHSQWHSQADRGRCLSNKFARRHGE
jgi:hypothetical protein